MTLFRNPGSDKLNFYIYKNSSEQTSNSNLSSWFANNPNYTAIAFKKDDIAVSTDNNISHTDSSAQIPENLITFKLGWGKDNTLGSNYYLNVYIQKFQYEPNRMNDSELNISTSAF